MTALYERLSERLGAPKKRKERGRSAVAKDRDRVIHSGALRRLQRKSQIVGVQSNDFFRTRLTHTLECAQIGRAIAARSTATSGLDGIVDDPTDLPDLIEAACLAHDLGHPPFGHNGEQALQAKMREHAGGLFEGNAQSMRIVTRLEPKVFRGVSLGLDLCATTLRAIVKYPCSEAAPLGSAEHPKFCFYDDADDRQITEWLYGDLAKAERTLAAEILEAADDIAYGAHDFEDGVWSGMIPLWQLHRDVGDARYRLRRRLAERGSGPDVAVDSLLEDLLAPVRDAGWIAQPFDRTLQSRAELKNFCAQLIGDLIGAVTPNKRFQRPLPTATEQRIDLLKAMAWKWMIEDPGQETVRFGQRRLVEDLFEGFWENPLMLPTRSEWNQLQDRSQTLPLTRRVWREKARLVCDHLAGMTDLYALHVHSEMFAGGGPPNLRLI